MIEDDDFAIMAHYHPAVPVKKVLAECQDLLGKLSAMMASLQNFLKSEPQSFPGYMHTPHLLGTAHDKIRVRIHPEANPEDQSPRRPVPSTPISQIKLDTGVCEKVSTTGAETIEPTMVPLDLVGQIVAPTVDRAEEKVLTHFILIPVRVHSQGGAFPAALYQYQWLSLGLKTFLRTSPNEQITMAQTIEFSDELLTGTDAAAVAAGAHELIRLSTSDNPTPCTLFVAFLVQRNGLASVVKFANAPVEADDVQFEKIFGVPMRSMMKDWVLLARRARLQYRSNPTVPCLLVLLLQGFDSLNLLPGLLTGIWCQSRQNWML